MQASNSRGFARFGAFCLAVALSFGLQAAVDPSGYVYLNADDPGATYSFAQNLGRWADNGQAIPSGTPMAADRDYLVQAASGYRVLRVGGNNTFPGVSLTLDGGELRCSGGNPFTVNNLIVYKGRIQCAAASQIKCAGALHLQDGGQLSLSGAMKRKLDIAAAIEGDSTTKIVVEASENVAGGTGTTLPYWVACLIGNNSNFKGSITVNCLTTGGKYPTALVAGSGSSLGAACPMAFASRAALLGDGLVLDDARTITVGDEFTIGASTANGLTLGGGVTIKGTGSSVVYVTNCVASAVTTLGSVTFDGVAKIILLAGTTQFASDFNNPSLPVEVAPGAKIAMSEGAVVGRITSTDPNGYVDAAAIVVPSFDRTAARRNNEGFSYPILSATTLDLGDFHLFYGVTRETFAVRNNAQGVPTLYWERTADTDHAVIYMAEANDGDSFAQNTSYSPKWSNTDWPKSDYDYIVENGYMLRSRQSRTFAGHLLSLIAGSDLSLYGVSSSVNDLRFMESSRVMVRGPNTGTFGGSAQILTSLNGYANFETENGTMTVSATLSGVGNLRYRGYNGGSTHTGTINVTGDNSAFAGRVALPHEKMTVRFKNEAAIGGNPRKFAADGLSLGNGVTLWCTATYQPSVTQPNRGVTLGGIVHFDVADGQTCTMSTPISGSGSIDKKSAGTLVLGGANSFAGGVTVNAGTLELGDADAVGGGNLRLATGTTLRLTASGIRVGGEIPFATADGSSAAGAVNLVVPAAAEEGFKSMELFVLTGVQDFDCTKFVLSNAGWYKFVKTLESDGLHITLKKRFGVILTVR